MATTQDFGVTKDTRIARRESDNWDAGSGASPGLPYGLYSGYRYRALLGFSINFAGWTSIVSATFNYKTSDQINVAFGSDPTMLIQRITGAWSEGTQSSLSASNASIYPGPSVTATNQVQEDAPTGENTWGAADITNILRDAMTTGVFHGIRILGSTNSSVESDSSANVGEIYSREGGSDAYIRVVYETNRAPNAPTVSSPDVANGGLCGSVTPTLNVNMTDPDGNAINNYRWQIDDNADFSSPIQDVTVGSGGANGFTAAVVPAALARGGTYYFRAQAADVSVWGGWSTTFSFKVASYPSLTVSEPSASGRLARIQYDAGSGWGSPRMVVNWGMACPDGGTQASWRVEVFNDSAGALGTSFNDSGTVGDTQSARIVPANLIEGNYYHVRVTATCSHGLTTVTGPYRVRARWGVVTHRFDMTTPPGSLALTTLDATDGAQGKVVVEYMTTTGAAPTTWASTIAGAGLNQFFYYRTWLLVWGASPAVSPTLNQLKITYSTAVITPDKWTLQDPANAAGDVGTYVYGTQSLRMKGKGSVHNAYQQIPVVPNTLYILSARIQTQGNPVASVAFSTGPTSGGVGIGTPNQAADIPFEDPRSRLASTVWNSGANTSIYIRCLVSGAVGTTAWFDAIKVEASSVVTPWSPGYIADAVVLDAGGMQIDGSSGGIFRLKGTAGGARDIVELGAQGLVLGGDTALTAPSDGVLAVDGVAVSPAHSHPYAATAHTHAAPAAPIRRVYTGDATWAKPASGLLYVEVECQAGGGGGGGTATNASGVNNVGGGGGGGGYSRRLIAASLLSGNYAIVVGTGGPGGGAGATGTAGELSSFTGTNAAVVGNGGGAGAGAPAGGGNATSAGGNGGSGSGGDHYAMGDDGGASRTVGGITASFGEGGGSYFGGRRRGPGVGGTALAGNAYGGGGTGASGTSSEAGKAGGAGAAGIVIVTEYYS
jgi:hypothetical protein